MEGIAPTTVPTIRMTTITMPDSNSTHHHEEDNHLLIFEGGKFSYVLIPPLPFEDPKLCFTDHGSGCEWDPRAEQCCLHEGGHVHAHVHNGEITEDVLLEQCMEEAGCALPMLWDLPGSCWKDFLEEKDHLHKAGCGHDQIAHGDHFDWVVPMNDGSFKLTHAYVNDDGVSQFVRHGRLVKVGESRGRLAKHPRQCFDLFEYEGPQLEGYKYRNSLMNMSTDLSSTLCTQPATSCPFMQNSSEVEKLLLQEDTTETLQVHVESKGGPQLELQKTTIDILGICCPAEVPLVKRILEPLPGVQKVLVNVAARTVTVRHDPALTSAAWLVKMLNDARLEASIHRQGEWKAAHKWPSPYTIACGIMVGLTFFQYMYSPLRWVGLAAVAVGIPPIILRGCVSLQRCILDINILMLIAVAGAIGLGDYLEAGSIVFLFTLADWLESRSSDKARLAISSVASLAPQNAFLADNGFKVPVAEVEVGTKLSVKAGDQVPIDGVVVCGKSVVDESSLTGESLPVEKVAGATVWAGTLNMTGYLCIETTALAEDSAVSRMVRLVEEAQTQRSHVEQLVEKFAKYYTPVVVIVAVAIATIPLCVHAHNVRHWLYVALVLLVVACPCALVISTPVTTTCAVARAARMGLIVKGGSSLEALGKLKVIAMDKTGTLTEGHFQVAEVRPLMNKNIDLPKLLYWISCIESKSSHPMASSFVAYAKLRGIEPSGEVEDFTILAGEGVSGVLDGHIIHIGNERLAKRLHWTEVIEAAEDSMLETWRSQGWSISWIGMDEKLEGLLCAGDHLRSEASEAVGDMRNLGLQIAMLTGDSLAAATAAQRELGEIEVHAQLLPQDKVEVLKQLRKIGLTGMVGDGINDAPALAAADVGIAMGVAGSAVAMETADIALMTNDLRQLAAAVKLGRKARRKIQQNIFLSLATKLLIIVLAGVGYASLWGAVLADVGTCLIVIFNSMLLLGREKEGELARHSHDHHIIDHKHCHDDDHINHTHHKHPHDDDDVRKASIKDCCCCCGGEGGTCSLLKLRLPDKFMSRCCKSRNGCCHDHSEHHVAKNFFVTSKAACCEFSGKRSTSNSRIRRRLGHKDTCEKDCQGIDCCNSTSAVIKPDGLIGTAIRSGDTCLNETAGAGRVLHPDQILGLIPASKEDDKYQVDLCAAYCGSAETASSCTAADDLLCASYCSSSEPQLLCQDVSACAFYCQADNSLESQCCGKVNNNTSQ